MSTAELVTCPHEGCEWSIAEQDEREAKYQRGLHLEQAHEGAAPAAAPPAEPPALAERHAGSVGTGRSITQINDELREAELRQTITVRCVDCVWESEGPQAEARMEWAEHRRDEHGDDQAVERTRAAIAGEGRRRRRPGAPVLPGGRDIETNLDKTRRAGGGHGAARPAAKEEEDEMQTSWTRELAIERLLAFHAENERFPRQEELRAPLPGVGVLKRLFGTETEAREQAAKRLTGRRPAATPPPAQAPAAPDDEPTPAPGEPEPTPSMPAATNGHGPLGTLALTVEERQEKLREAQAALGQAELDLAESITALEGAIAALRPPSQAATT